MEGAGRKAGKNPASPPPVSPDKIGVSAVGGARPDCRLRLSTFEKLLIFSEVWLKVDNRGRRVCGGVSDKPSDAKRWMG